MCLPWVNVVIENMLNSIVSSTSWTRTEHTLAPICWFSTILSPVRVSISDKTSDFRISQSLEAARFVLRIVQSFSNLTGSSTAVMPMCLSNFKAMRWFKLPISRLRDLVRSYDKTSYRKLKRGPGPWVELGMEFLEIANEHLFVVIDYHSRWSDVACIRDTRTCKVIGCLEIMFATHELPIHNPTNNGSRFAFQEFEKFCGYFGNWTHRRAILDIVQWR